MSLLFIAAALLQWNDPDPLLWILAYASTALFAAAHAGGRRVPGATCAALSLVLAGWAVSLTPSMLEADSNAYTAFAMQDLIAEEARESLGLWISAAYLAWLSLWSRHATYP